MLWPSYVSRYCPLYALEHLWILPSSVPTRNRCSLCRLKSKQQPPAKPEREVSSGSSCVRKSQRRVFPRRRHPEKGKTAVHGGHENILVGRSRLSSLSQTYQEGMSKAQGGAPHRQRKQTTDRLPGLTLMVLTSFSCITGSILSSFLDMTQLATRPSEEMLKKFSSLGWSSLCQ